MPSTAKSLQLHPKLSGAGYTYTISVEMSLKRDQSEKNECASPSRNVYRAGHAAAFQDVELRSYHAERVVATAHLDLL